MAALSQYSYPDMDRCLRDEPTHGSVLHICEMPYPYLSWEDTYPGETSPGTSFRTRKANALNNMYTQLNYFINTDWREMERKLLTEGVSLHVGRPADFFDVRTAFLNGNHSLNIRGNVVLDGSREWNPYPEYARHFNTRFFFGRDYDQSSAARNSILQVDPNTDILYNYTVSPNISFYDRKEAQYYAHMQNAIKLGMDAMYKDLDNSPDSKIRVWNYNTGAAAAGAVPLTKPKVLIWNPFGLGAFLVRYKGDQEAVKERVIRSMLEIYRDGDYENSKLIYVGKGIIPDADFRRIFDEVYNNGTAATAATAAATAAATGYDLKANKKSVILASGDMLDIARETRLMGHPTAVSMAADTIGLGNKFFQLPNYGKQGHARKASDENNTRRSNIIWKVFYINLNRVLATKGKEATLDLVNVRGAVEDRKRRLGAKVDYDLLNAYNLEELGKKINNAYHDRARGNVEDAARAIGIPL